MLYEPVVWAVWATENVGKWARLKTFMNYDIGGPYESMMTILMMSTG